WANLDAESAAGAVFGRDLQGVSQILEFSPAWFLALERLRGVRQQRGIVDLGADYCVRADQHAFTTLDAQLLVPDGDLLSDVSLLPLGGAGGEGAVRRERADGQLIAAIASTRGRIPLMAKKQVCMMVLMRRPMPVSRATA